MKSTMHQSGRAVSLDLQAASLEMTGTQIIHSEQDEYPTKKDYIITAVYSVLWLAIITFPLWGCLIA